MSIKCTKEEEDGWAKANPNARPLGRWSTVTAFDLDDLTGKYGNVNSLVFPRLKLELTHKHVDTRAVPYLLSSNISNIPVFHV